MYACFVAFFYHKLVNKDLYKSRLQGMTIRLYSCATRSGIGFWCRVSSSVAGWSRTKLFEIYSFGPLQPVTDSVDHWHHLWTNIGDLSIASTQRSGDWCPRWNDCKTSEILLMLQLSMFV